MVVLFHVPVNSHLQSLALVRNGSLYVDFFFVLSGFIIATKYYEPLRNGFGIIRFAVLRFGRLYPLHAFVLGLLVAWFSLRLVRGDSLFDESNSLDNLLFHVLLLNSMGLQDDLGWNFPSWSIGAEFYSYLLFAAVASWTGRHSTWVFLLLIAICASVLVNIAPTGMSSDYDFGFIRGLYGFLLGFFVWRANKIWHGQQIYRRIEQALGRGGWTLLEIAATAGGIAVIVSFLSGKESLLIPVAFSAMVFVFAQQRGRLSSVLMAPGFQRLGELSYSIYMLHALVILIILNAIFLYYSLFPDPAAGGNVKTIPSMNPYLGDLVNLITLGIVIAVSRMTYRSIERPGRMLFRRLADKEAGWPFNIAIGNRWR